MSNKTAAKRICDQGIDTQKQTNQPKQNKTKQKPTEYNEVSQRQVSKFCSILSQKVSIRYQVQDHQVKVKNVAT